MKYLTELAEPKSLCLLAVELKSDNSIAPSNVKHIVIRSTSPKAHIVRLYRSYVNIFDRVSGHKTYQDTPLLV